MSRTVTYRGHHIRAQAVPVADSEEGAWAAQAIIRPPTAAGVEHPLLDPDDRTFGSEEDAEGYAVHLAMGWVDRHGL